MWKIIIAGEPVTKQKACDAGLMPDRAILGQENLLFKIGCKDMAYSMAQFLNPKGEECSINTLTPEEMALAVEGKL